MADGRTEGDWMRAAILAAPLYNAIRDPKHKPEPYTPKDFYPFPWPHAEKAEKPPIVGIDALKVFVKKKRKTPPTPKTGEPPHER